MPSKDQPQKSQTTDRHIPIDPDSIPWIAGYRDAQHGIVGNEADYPIDQRPSYIDGWLTGDAEKDGDQHAPE